ncbi:MAG: hypothetical protein M1834_009543 [Cirrosporium novae-zelandiae]|nr:MAG: hypothetical protein M1834_009543 [Cirrosporium novae-zelandiae]
MADPGDSIEADTNDQHSEDDDDETLPRSITSSIYQYREENGHTYHAYKDGLYPYPNDPNELDRLDLQHHLLKLTLGQRLFLAPIKKNPQNVLDIATGTGVWAGEFADDYPSCLVTANDLSPSQAFELPPNVLFEVDDANEPWIYHRRFDFIHARQHHGAVEEKRLMQQSLEFLHPEGWLEMQEYSFPMKCDDNTFPSDCSLYKWSELMVEASRQIGQDLHKPVYYEQWMKDAGFVNVKAMVYKIPTNKWPREKNEKTKGLWQMANILQGLSGVTLALFTRVLGWQASEIEEFLKGVQKDIRNRNIHAYWEFYAVYGQKSKIAEHQEMARIQTPYSSNTSVGNDARGREAKHPGGMVGGRALVNVQDRMPLRLGRPARSGPLTRPEAENRKPGTLHPPFQRYMTINIKQNSFETLQYQQ